MASENGYPVSTDYDRLWRLAQEGRRVVCFVDGRRGYRDIARTLALDDGVVEISVRGLCYVHAETAQKFKRRCEADHVTFIEPEPLTNPRGGRAGDGGRGR